MEYFIHFLTALQPFLLSIKESIVVFIIALSIYANFVIVFFCIFLIGEKHIIGSNQLDAIFLCQSNKDIINLVLLYNSVTVGSNGWIFNFVALQLQIIIIAKQVMVPLNGFLCSLFIVV